MKLMENFDQQQAKLIVMVEESKQETPI